MPPDHSTISRTRRLITVETHRAVSTWVAQCLGHAGLIIGNTIGLDANKLEANAALRSIVRRDSGEGYEEFLTRLARPRALARRRGPTWRGSIGSARRRGSNDEGTHPRRSRCQDHKMKDGRTHLAHKAEHAIDLETRRDCSASRCKAPTRATRPRCSRRSLKPRHNSKRWPRSPMTPSSRSRKLSPTRAITAERPSTIWRRSRFAPRSASLTAGHNRGSISAPKRDAVYANRRRIRGARGKRLLQCAVAADRRGDRLDTGARRVADTSPAHFDWFDYLCVKTALVLRAARREKISEERKSRLRGRSGRHRADHGQPRSLPPHRGSNRS